MELLDWARGSRGLLVPLKVVSIAWCGLRVPSCVTADGAQLLCCFFAQLLSGALRV